jgi:hypothetical protein
MSQVARIVCTEVMCTETGDFSADRGMENEAHGNRRNPLSSFHIRSNLGFRILLSQLSRMKVRLARTSFGLAASCYGKTLGVGASDRDAAQRRPVAVHQRLLRPAWTGVAVQLRSREDRWQPAQPDASCPGDRSPVQGMCRRSVAFDCGLTSL